jgi:hypothetical protein
LRRTHGDTAIVGIRVGVLQPGLAAVRVRHPTEVVVERPVLHHQHDDRVDGEVARRGQEPAALVARRLGDERVGRQQRCERRREPGGQRGPLQELATAQLFVVVVQIGHRRHGSRRCTGNVAVA